MKTQELLVIVASVCLMAFFNVVSFAQTDPVQSDDVQSNIGPFLMDMLQTDQTDECESPCLTIIGGLVDFLQNQQDALDQCEAQLEECEGTNGALAPVPRTGQTQSYAAGDDGDLQKGVPWPNPRFTDNADGTVTDNLTGLIWLKDAGCTNDGEYSGVGLWQVVLQEISTLEDGTCGLDDGSVAGDWRLPNVREVLSLIDYNNLGPALPTGHPFINLPATSQLYWTSTTSVLDDDDAYRIDFTTPDGIAPVEKMSASYYAWPVRGGN